MFPTASSAMPFIQHFHYKYTKDDLISYHITSDL
jgi:hypothetical protein